MKKYVILILSFFLFFLVSLTTASADTTILSWNAPTTNADGSPLTDLAGYKVYYGDSSGTYTTNIDVGNVTSYTVTGLSSGTYYFTVTAYDTSANESHYAKEVYKTISLNQPPSVSLINSSSSGTAPLTVSFTANASDLDGSIVSYEWDIDGDGTYDQNTGTTATNSYTFNSPGIYNSSVRVTDNNGATSTDNVTMLVSAPNQLPTVSLSASSTSGTIPLSVSFSANAYDPDGSIVSYEWDLDGDGDFDQRTGTSSTASHTYFSVNTVNARVRATDDDGATGVDSLIITVSDPPENPSEPGLDSDGDGIPDTLDLGPNGESLSLDSDNDGFDNLIDGDYDNDGIPDDEDAYPFDTDNDGLENAEDDDDDGDGISDRIEMDNGTNPLNPDTNGDGKKDSANFSDSDGDGMVDDADPYPLIPQADIDTDGDGIRDDHDSDTDNDGIHNSLDLYPYDTDNDGWNNLDSNGSESILSDNDDDGDNYPDDIDAFPLDTDNDGLNNGEDDDSDGDGVSDIFETIVGTDPLNPLDNSNVARLSAIKIDPSVAGEVNYDYSEFSKYYTHTPVLFQFDADTLRYSVPPIVEVREGDNSLFEDLPRRYVPVGEVLEIHGGIIPGQTITFPLPISGDYMGDRASIIVQFYNGSSWENVWTIASISNDVVYVNITHFSKWRLVGKKTKRDRYKRHKIR